MMPGFLLSLCDAVRNRCRAHSRHRCCPPAPSLTAFHPIARLLQQRVCVSVKVVAVSVIDDGDQTKAAQPIAEDNLSAKNTRYRRANGTGRSMPRHCRFVPARVSPNLYPNPSFERSWQ